MENQVQKQSVHYCAFISYRHVSPDQEIAARLHRLIERYTVPKALRGSEGQRHPGRVFRDQEELPLSADLGKDIETALDHSDYLICICTPRYLESRWCMREVDYFIAKHGREKVLTLLAEGEPGDSFPEQLMYETLPDGTRTETEPLAADVRGKSIQEHLKKLNREKLRILAPMLNTTFDGLYQRARRRRMRNGLIIAMSALVLAGGFLAYALVQNRKLAEQRETAARNEMDLLVEKSLSRTAENRKKEARELALEARNLSATLDGYGDERVRDALAVTCYAGDFAVETQLDIPGVYAEYYRFSPDGSRIAAVVSSAAVFCYDAETGEELWNSTPSDMMLTSLEWKKDGSALVTTSTTGHRIYVLDGKDGHVINSIGYEWVSGACFDGDKVLCCGGPGIALWDPAANEEQIPLIEQFESIASGTACIVTGYGNNLLLADYTNQKILAVDIGNQRSGEMTLEDPRIITAAGLSPDGNQLYVRQYRKISLYNMETDQVIWTRETEEDELTGVGMAMVSAAVWNGNRIFDSGVILNAETGETIGNTGETHAFASSDGEYFLCPKGIYRASDAGLYCSIPGELLAADSSGKYLLIRKDAVSSRNLMPGTGGSTKQKEHYEGTILDIPDWTNPAEGESLPSLYDPVMWGSSSAEASMMQRLLISPNLRFFVQINAGNHIKIYDMEKGNEPVHRIYGYQQNGPGGLYIADASFSADGKRLAVAGEMGSAGVYDLETGKVLRFWDDLYLVTTLQGIKFNTDGTLIMLSTFQNRRFRICSVENGLVLYDLYPVKNVQDWGFDAETGDGVILYEDGSAYIADIFTTAEELYQYAGNEGSK